MHRSSLQVLVTRKTTANIDQSLWDTMQIITGQMERKDNFMSNSCLWVKEVNCSYQVEHVLFYCIRNAEAREELDAKVLGAMEAYRV